MKIIGLKAYQKGYTGCVEDKDTYILFNFTHHTYKPIREYPLHAFENRKHFISTMSKFVRTSFFLKEPVEIAIVTQDSLNRCYAIMEPHE
jgi:hypothetical protein